jgi:hypothetical protein
VLLKAINILALTLLELKVINLHTVWPGSILWAEQLLLLLISKNFIIDGSNKRAGKIQQVRGEQTLFYSRDRSTALFFLYSPNVILIKDIQIEQKKIH